jgi:exodeoxyribonuclease VII large subunit
MIKKIQKENTVIGKNNNIPEKQIPSISLTDYLKKIGTVISTYVAKNQWVFCEIISFNKTATGTIYFEIVDTNEKSQRTKGQSATLFKNKAISLFSKFNTQTGVPLSKGMKVMLQLNANFDPKFGMSLYIEDINPAFTIGEMEAKANNIRAAMITQGIDKRNKSISFPQHFTKVAVLSPSGAAGLGDFKVEADLLEKHGLCEFLYFTATFEGDTVETTILEAFKKIHLSGFDNYDCLVFIRGGGAKSSLQCLNEELIIKCVCRTPIPVISGIGHEKDKVLIDEYSALSLDTPSKVIEYITNIITKNYMDALGNVNDVYNITEQVISRYEQESNLKCESNYNLIESHLSNGENNLKLLCEMIYSKSVEVLNESESEVKSIVQQIDSKSYEILNESESEVKSIVQKIDSKSYEILKESESEVSSIVQKIDSEIDAKLQNFENIMTNNIDGILSELMKVAELSEKDAKSILSEIRELDPTKVIGRGYSIIKSNSEIIDSIEILNGLEKITIIMKDGQKEFTIK